MKRIILLILIVTVHETVFSQCPELEILNLKKTALIIGEKSYVHANPLKNPINDAKDIADSLRGIGFDVTVYMDLDLKTINAAVDQWCSKLSSYNVALFYFSGHGAEYNSENYLFPIDANPSQANEMAFQCLSANTLLSKLDNTNIRYNIMILDACRSNPFAKSWVRDFSGGGLAAMTGKGTFIGYAASPGKTASDGIGRNGTYTEGLLKYITVPGLTIDQIFTKVNSYVRTATKETQIPFKNSSLSSEYCFSVKRSRLSPVNNSHRLIQPASEALLTGDQSFLINITDTGILIKDALSLHALQPIYISSTRPILITSKTGEYVIAVDSFNKRIINIDSKLKSIRSIIPLMYTPTTVALSNIGEKVYVGFSDYKTGGLYVIDLNLGNIIKTVRLNEIPKAICLTNNDKKIIVLTSNSLMQIDAASNSGTPIKTIQIEGGQSLGLSPTNKLIMVGTFKNDTGNTLVIDAVTFTLKKTIEFKSDLFSFTLDSLRVLAASSKEIYTVDLQTFAITNRIPFKSSIKGIAISSDGIVNIWLRDENRYHVYKLDQLINSPTVDPEIKLKEFKETAKNDYVEAMEEQNKIETIFHTAQAVYESTVNKIKDELGPAYSITTRGGTRFINHGDSIGIYAPRSFGERYAIYGFDRKKSISTHYVCKLTSKDFLLKIYDESNKKNPPDIYKTTLDNIDWEEMKAFVRKYFLLKLDRLRE